MLIFLLIPFLAFSVDFILFKRVEKEEIISDMERARVIYLGEIHDRKDIKEFQLRVLEDLWERGHRLILLMEAFQQPFQEALDEYINGEIEEQEMLERTEYRKRWGFNSELYAPLWRFAKRNGIKLFALNVPSELLKEVRKKGLEGVKSRYLPKKRMPLRKEHREFLLRALREHPGDIDEERFLSVQMAWDMGMAYRIAKLALAYPDHKLVVIVGGGHVWKGYGIPERVNFLIGELSQAVLYLREDRAYFLFSKDFSKESSSANSSNDPN